MVLISYTYVLFFILAFVADILPLVKLMHSIVALNKTSLKTIRSDGIEDAVKQKLLLANSAGIFKQSAKIIALIVLVLAIGCLLAFIGELMGIAKTAIFFGFLETITGMIVCVMAFFSWFLIKKIYARARL